MNPMLVEELVGDLEAEVNNGGFDQFFFNSSGDRTAETIQALQLIGASHTARIVAQAAALFPGGMPPTNRLQRQLQLEAVSPGSEAFEELDRAFLAYQDDLASLVEKYGLDHGA